MKGAVLVALVGSLAVLACAGHQEPGGAGTACYRDSDCKAGLVCVANTAGTRLCSDDVSGLVGSVEGPPPPEDAGMPADPYDGGEMDGG
jgi:hypothetical protein